MLRVAARRSSLSLRPLRGSRYLEASAGFKVIINTVLFGQGPCGIVIGDDSSAALRAPIAMLR